MWFTASPLAAYTSVRPTAKWPRSLWTIRTRFRHAKRRPRAGAAFAGFPAFSTGAAAPSAAPAAPSSIALLFPRIGVVVVAARLPVPRPVRLHEVDPGEPFRALPEVEVRHERPRRRPVRPRERVTAVLVR